MVVLDAVYEVDDFAAVVVLGEKCVPRCVEVTAECSVPHSSLIGVEVLRGGLDVSG